MFAKVLEAKGNTCENPKLKKLFFQTAKFSQTRHQLLGNAGDDGKATLHGSNRNQRRAWNGRVRSLSPYVESGTLEFQ